MKPWTKIQLKSSVFWTIFRLTNTFDLYKEHQDNTYLPLTENPGDYRGLPQTSSTASINEETGVVCYSVSNADSENSAEMEIAISGIASIGEATAKLLTAPEITAHNTKENPDNVHIIKFNELNISGIKIAFRLPPRSVMTISIKNTAD